jgi:hypothetical protein
MLSLRGAVVVNFKYQENQVSNYVALCFEVLLGVFDLLRFLAVN